MFIEPRSPVSDFAFDPGNRLHRAMLGHAGRDGRMVWSDTFGRRAVAALRVEGPDQAYLVVMGCRQEPSDIMVTTTLCVIDPADPKPGSMQGRYARATALLDAIGQGWVCTWVGEGATSPAGILVRRPEDGRWEWAFVRFAPSWVFCEADMILPGEALA